MFTSEAFPPQLSGGAKLYDRLIDQQFLCICAMAFVPNFEDGLHVPTALLAAAILAIVLSLRRESIRTFTASLLSSSIHVSFAAHLVPEIYNWSQWLTACISDCFSSLLQHQTPP